MMFTRSAASRSARQIRLSRVPRRNPPSSQWRSGRRNYSTTSETAEKAKEGAKKGSEKAKEGAKQGSQFLKRSDLPFALAAVVVTVPSTYLILANGPDPAEKGYPGDRWHGEGHEEEEEHEEEEGGEEGEGEGEGDDQGADMAEREEKQEEGEEKEDGAEEKQEGDGEQQQGGGEEKSKGGEGQSEGSDAHSEGGEEQSQEGGEDNSEDQGDNDGGAPSMKRSDGKDTPGEPTEDKISKKTKSGEDAKFTDTVELDNGDSDSKKIHKPDAKGGAKRRIESSYGNKLGKSEDDGDFGPSGVEAKEGSVMSKQKGISNTDTKHSIDIGNDPEKSKKAPGVPDTAKLQGTVDPSKPAKGA